MTSYQPREPTRRSTVRYSMTEILDIWDAADDPHWDAILDEVIVQYGDGTPKYDQFYNRGTDAGVRH